MTNPVHNAKYKRRCLTRLVDSPQVDKHAQRPRPPRRSGSVAYLPRGVVPLGRLERDTRKRVRNQGRNVRRVG